MALGGRLGALLNVLPDRTGARQASSPVLSVPRPLIMTPLAITPNMGKQETNEINIFIKTSTSPKLKIKNHHHQQKNPEIKKKKNTDGSRVNFSFLKKKKKKFNPKAQSTIP